MRLYNISEVDILEVVDLPDVIEKEGNKSIAIKKFKESFSGYPLKVVYEKTKEGIFIISTYPLKKKIWR